MGVKIREKPAKSGVWWVFINHNGQRRSKRIGPKREAQQIQKEIIQRLAAGDLGMLEEKPKVMAFGEYATIWLAGTVQESKAASTAYDYECIVGKHLKGAKIFKRPINEIKKSDVKALLRRKRESGLADSTVVHIKNVISGIFHEAMEDDEDLLSKNPAHGINFGNKKKQASRKPKI